MNPVNRSVFNLPDRLAAKADPALIADDERHFAALAQCLDDTVTALTARLAELRLAPGRGGQEAMERDAEIHRLSARRRALRRFGVDLCLGRMVSAETGEPVHLGRLGLTDSAGRTLLIDWRAPAAEPFFGATHAQPMGLASRRRYQWSRGRIRDYWDEVFTPDAVLDRAALDDHSAFINSLGTHRSPRMRDVVGTIQADQDAIIRAPSHGTLVVDGGPGTGKTVVALHRSAYLLYADPRLRHGRGGVLFVGPGEQYLAYVSDVLPGLGEDGVQTCTLRELVTEGEKADVETDPVVADLKSSTAMVDAIEAAVAFHEQAPTTALTITTPWDEVGVTAADWAEAFATPEFGTAHNDARDTIKAALVETLSDRHDPDVPADRLRQSLQRNGDLNAALNRAWPMVEAAELVADLWSVPAYLRHCAPWLTPKQVRALQRADPQAWTTADLPLLDAARRRLGDPEAAGRARQAAAALAADHAYMTTVVDDAIEADDSELMIMSMLRGDDLRVALEDEDALPTVETNPLAGPFAHIVVDEAQELTDAQWQMLLARCPSRSFTVVGDRAQARRGFAESWSDRLQRNGLDQITDMALTINYRTPAEIIAVAEPVIRAMLPDANVPTSIRSVDRAVRYGMTAERDQVLDDWLAAHSDGIACVIGDPGAEHTDRVSVLTPEQAKGLEFDLVVLVNPEAFGEDVSGAVDRYVAMTRATQQLVILTHGVSRSVG